MSFQRHVARISLPAVIVHGGAGSYLRTTTPEQRRERGRHLSSVAKAGRDALLEHDDALTAALVAVEAMEADPRYNAGYGAKLQQDGRARVSAAVMLGETTRLAAVYNVEGCKHPTRLAAALLERGDRNLDGTGARELMAALGVEVSDLTTPQTRARWRDLLARGDTADAEAAIGDADLDALSAARKAALPVPDDLEALKPEERFGTVGVVAVDSRGAVVAVTSTGGRGHEYVGRISDSPTPAGNYACPSVGLSATGFGEQILDLNLAGRIATRIVDGASLADALDRTFEEVVAHGGLLGVIALTREGDAGYAYSTEACGVAWADAAGREHIDPHGR